MESITFADHPFLKELGLEETNLGCYRAGEWVSGDQIVTSNDPNTNKSIAHTKLATLE